MFPLSNTKLHAGDELRCKTKIDYFSLCTGFCEMTAGILESILAVGILKVEVAQNRALLMCGKRKCIFDGIVWSLFT